MPTKGVVRQEEEKDDFGKDLGLVHEMVITGRKMGKDRQRPFYSILAHNEDLFREVIGWVDERTSLRGQLARVRGYEIHQGRTTTEPGTPPAFTLTQLFNEPASQLDGAGVSLALFGTYLHGLFDHSDFRQAYLNRLREYKGLTPLPPHAYDTRRKDFDQLADWLCDHLDLRQVSEIVGLPLE